MHMLVLAAFSLVPLAAAAQSYPVKPIRIISGQPTGNSSDFAIRAIAPVMSNNLGQPVLVENRQAAGGRLAAEAVKNAPPDGYVLLLSASSAMVSATYLVKDVPYQTLTDFTPITKLLTVPTVVAIHSSIPAQTFPELLNYARKFPGKLAFGSTGFGTVFHMTGEMLAIDHGIQWLHVPYSSGGLGVVVTDLASNRIQVFFPSISSLAPVLKGGNVKVIAVLDKQRLKLLPDVPAINEHYPNFTGLPSWFGVFGPHGLPQAIVSRLNTELRVSLHRPEIVSRLEAMASIPIGGTPEDFAQELKINIAQMGKLTNTLGIKPE